MSGAVTWADMRAASARRARARNRRIEAGRASAAWPEFSPQVHLGSGPLGEAQAADREIARMYALRARKLAEFADSRPAAADRAQGEPGAMSAERWSARPEVLRDVSEWATPEVSIGLTRTQVRAEGLLEESLALVHTLPGALAALEGGLLTPEHLRPLLEHVAVIADPQLRAKIEAEVLRWVAERAADRTITTPPQLADRVLRVVKRRDARDAAQRALKALRDRGVYRRAGRGEGLAELVVVGTVPEIEALHTALAACVDALPADPSDARTRDQKMLDVLLDLVLRPGQNDVPPVQVVLTLVLAVQTALGGDAPAELNGRVVSAETARQLLDALAGAGLGAGALAELQRLAGAADPDAESSAAQVLDAEPPDAEPPDAEPPDAEVRDAGPPDARAAAGDRFVDDPGWEPWEPEMQGPLAEWEADWQRRLDAGLVDDPDPMPDDVAVALAGQRAADGEIDLELDRLLSEAQERWWVEFEAGRIPDPDPPEVRTESPPGDPTDPPPDDALPTSQWWAAADRAVRAASAAQLAAEQALAHAGRLVRVAARADAADEQAWRRSGAGRVAAAEDAVAAVRAATAADRAALVDLLTRTAGGGLADRPRLALVDALSGALVSLTDLSGLRRAAHCGRPACRRRPDRCDHDLSGRPGLGAPPPSDGYRPGAGLERFVRARDRRCRFPGCRRRVRAGELDHHLPYPLGATSAANLVGLCASDHRGKHQAPGCTHHLDAGGTLTVTTPSGLVATTGPPPF
ncbi:HNH endonuclease [Geodermatophilus sp. SYSU D00815]